MLILQLASSALVMGLFVTVPPDTSSNRQPAMPGVVLSVPAVTSNGFQLAYRLQLDGRDTTGQYLWSGSVEGPTHGEATVRLSFQNGQSPHPGRAPVQTRWLVRASREAESFEATLNGTIDMVSGRAHLVGVIIAGAGRGQRVETNSQLFNLGENAALSEASGTMSIASAPAEWARAEASPLPSERETSTLTR
jgi:hypothetical protein